MPTRRPRPCCSAVDLSRAAGALSLALLGATPLPASAQQLNLMADPPAVRPCPSGAPADAKCLMGRDYLGAWYWMAMPRTWNGVLVMHAHGGPELGDPKPERSAEDLTRWSVFVRAGYAWAGSTYRQGGVEVVAAGEDTERLRQTFVAEFGEPKRTLLHGQSWGASVAARMAERYTTPDIDPRRLRGLAAVPSTSAAPATVSASGPGSGAGFISGSARSWSAAGSTVIGKPTYDGLLLTSGVLGGARSYDMRMDLRAVYQSVCHNHPKPDEAAYPLWMGLPVDAKLSRDDLDQRVDACTGVRRKAADRSPAQKRALATITQAVHIPEDALLGHMAWATYHFHDIAWRKLKGRGAFGNEGVRYVGTADDDALNASVPRYKADAVARAALQADIDPTGLIQVPVFTVHGVHDATAFVELESEFRTRMEEAGKLDNLVQIFTDDRTHSYSSDAQVLAATRSLLDWVERGDKPTPASVAARCKALEPVWQPAQGCRVVVDYRPAPLVSRVPLRASDAVATLPGAPAVLSTPAGSGTAPDAPALLPRPAMPPPLFPQ
jgi:hypothetical protein